MPMSHTAIYKQRYFMLFGSLWILLGLLLGTGCTSKVEWSGHYIQQDTLYIDRAIYSNALEGFWLGTSIGNWTGLVTEMDKIGDIGEIRTGAFYTREDWGKPDEPNIWDEGQPSQLSETIDFVLRSPGQHWGADDDTDIEYMYQYLMLKHSTTRLTPQQIQHGWLSHIATEEENYLWVSNQRALDLMAQGYVPPRTSEPALETIRIGSLAGWDSDNPTATWAGLLGFMMGADAVEAAFGQPLSRSFHIHRTRQGFSNDGYDTFPNMAKNGLKVVDMVVTGELNGRVDAFRNRWAIPLPASTLTRNESYTRSTTR